MSFDCVIQPPPDGFDKMERAFLREFIIQIYTILKNPEDKFILIATQEMGYPQEIVAKMIGKSQVMVSTRLKQIQIFLRSHPISKDMI